MSSNSSSSSLRVLTIESFAVLIFFPAQQHIPSLLMKLIFFLTMMDKEEEYSGKWATTLKSLAPTLKLSDLLCILCLHFSCIL